MLRTVFICTVFLLVLVECKHQAIPFSPIHPGSIHADHFSPLSGSSILVDIWEAETFSSTLLDFASLTSFTPVTFDIAGGISFNNQNFRNDNKGPIYINSETNNLNLESLHGGINFNSYATTSLGTYGTDINIESFRDSVALLARDEIQFTAPGISLAGNYEDGILLTASSLSFTSGLSSAIGHFDFTGEDVYFQGDQAINIDASSSFLLSSLHLLAINTDGNSDFITSDGIVVRSLSGPSEFEATEVNNRASTFLNFADGAAVFTAVLGEIHLLAGSIDVSSAQQVKFTAVDSIIATAVDDLLFDGADSIQLFGNVLAYTTINTLSSDLHIESQKDAVTIFSQDNLTIDGNTFKSTATDSHFTGQQLYEVDSTTITLDSTHRSVYEAGNLISLNGKNGKILVDASDDLYINSDDFVSFSAPVVAFTVSDDAYFEFGADLVLTSTNQLSFQWQTAATFRGENRLHMNSEKELLMTSTSLSMTSADNTFITANNNILVSTNGAGGDVIVNAPYLNYFASKNSLHYTTTTGYTVTSSSEIDILSEISTDFHSDANIFITSAHNTDISGSSLTHSAIGNFEFTADDELQVTTQNLLTFSSDSFTSFEAEKWFRLEAGDFIANGTNISLTSDDVHIFTRKTGLLRSSNGPIEVGVDGVIDFLSSGQLTVNADEKLTIDGVSIIWEATDYFQGDVLFSSKLSDFDISASGVTMHGDRFQSYSETGIIFNAKSDHFTIEQKLDTDAGDYGNIIFQSSGTTSHDSNTLSLNGRDWDISADDSLIVDADFTVSFTTEDSTGTSFIGSTYTNVFFTAKDATFNSETTDLNSQYNTTITSGTTLIQTGDLTNSADITSEFNGKSIVTTVIGDYTATVVEETTMEGSSVTFNTAGYNIQSSGGGGIYTASSLIRFSVKSDEISSTSNEDILFTAETSGISFTSKHGDVISEGGAHFAESTLSTHFVSDTLTASTLDNGFTSIRSDYSIVQDVTGTFEFNGIQTPLESFGRSGLIESTEVDGHICIVTNSPSAPFDPEGGGGGVSERDFIDFQVISASTSFTGESVLFTASGPNAELILDAQGGIGVTGTNSINIHAYGFIPSDPQFYLEDQTFGVLLRTEGTISPITFSSGGDYTVYSNEDLLIFSEDGTLSSTNRNEMDFRTYQENADIIVRTREGDILTSVTEDAFYNSGTPYLPADTLVNATKNIILTSNEGSIYWNQLGTSSDPNKLGIQLDSYGVIDIFAKNDISLSAEDGGIVNIETRQGNMNFKSSTNDITQTAETGTIYWEGRGSATFTTPTYSIDANGDGGSIYLHSGADNKFTIDATGTKLFFEAVHGEIDVTGTEAINADIDSNFLINALKTTIEGGSIYFTSATDISFTSTYPSQIGLSATVEFTVDAIDSIDFSALKEIELRSGGSTDQAGISMTATIGDITYTNTGTDTNLDGVNIDFTSVGDTTITTADNINIFSTLDSFEEDNILIQSQTSSISFTSVGSLSSGSISQKTTSKDFTLTAKDVVFSGSRELRYTVLSSFDHTLSNSFNIDGGNINIDAVGKFSLSTALDIQIIADSYLNLDVGTSTTFKASSLTHDVYGEGSLIHLEAAGLFNIRQRDFTVTTGSLIDLDNAAFSLTTAKLTYSVGTDYHQKSIDDYILTASKFDEISGRSQISNIDGTFGLVSTTINIDSIIFETTSLRDLTVATTNTLLNSAIGQPLSFYAEDELSIITTGFTTSVANAILVENYYFAGEISYSHASIKETTSKQVVSGENIVEYSAEDLITLNINNLSLQGSGDDGVEIMAFDDYTLTSPTASFLANGGNVKIFAEDALVPLTLTTGGPLSFISHSDFGDIQLLSPTSISYTTRTANFKQYAGASTRGADGKISFVASGILTVTPATSLTFDSDDNVNIKAESVNLNLPTASVSSSSLDLFQAGKIIRATAGAFTAQTLDSPAVAADESKIQIKTNVAAISSSASTIGYTADDEFESITEVLFVSPTGDLEITTASPLNFAAELGGINLSFGSGTFTARSDTRYSAVGNAGRIDVDAPTVSFRTSNFRYEAQGSIWAPFSTITTTTANFNSAKDISLRSDGTITLRSSNGALTTRSRLDGRVIVNSESTISVSSANNVIIRAEGMLSNTNGRYVLEDSYWQTTGFTNFNDLTPQDHRINRNTDAIEFNAVNGNVRATITNAITMNANYGSIEFRAQNAVRYYVPNNGYIRFFGITPNAPYVVPNNPTGQLRTWPYERSGDYCDVAGSLQNNLDCTQLSTVINEIVNAMIQYGLFQCSTTLWCASVI